MKSESLGFKSVLCKIENKETGEIEVMKVIDIHSVKKRIIGEVYEALREINAVSHVNLMKINQLEVKEDKLILKMPEYQLSLHLINPLKYFEESGIYEALRCLCNGVKELNELGKYHGNLKPSNIFFDKNRNAILSDYLFPKLYKGNNELRSQRIDDLCYISVEELLNEEIDESVDIWGIGCVFYFLLKNENIFEGKNIRETIDNICDCKYNKLEGEFSDEYNNLLGKMIVKEKKKRIRIDDIVNEIQKMNEPYLPVEPLEDSDEDDEEEIELESRIKEYQKNNQNELYLGSSNISEKGNKIKGTDIKLGDNGLLCLCKKLKKLNNLKMLNLFCNEITSIGIRKLSESLKYLCELEFLDIGRNHINDDGIESLINNLKYVPHLKILYVVECGITSIGMNRLGESLRLIPELEGLSVGGNEINDDGIESLSNNLKSIHHLKILYVWNCGFTSIEIKKLSESFRLIPELEKISVGGNKIGDDGIELLSNNLKYIPHLKELYVWDCGITSVGISKLSESLKYITELEFLSIYRNEIEDDGIESLSNNLKYIPHIKRLYIWNCGISDNGFKSLSIHLKDIPHLELLAIGKNEIGDESVKVFLENIEYIPELRELYLDNTKMSDESANLLPIYLSKCKKLEKVNIRNNSISNKDDLKYQILSSHSNKELSVEI